jgi:preprotein translocase subunit SecB
LPATPIDFVALARVSSRAELTGIRLAEISAKCEAHLGGTLEADLRSDCQVVGQEKDTLRVACNYEFKVTITQVKVAEASVRYLLEYRLHGDEPFAEEDIAQFALANGTLHSWPFLRELLHSLTSRMGYPPYLLPVVHFVPKPRKKSKQHVAPAVR